jgi:hypothetical protein
VPEELSLRGPFRPILIYSSVPDEAASRLRKQGRVPLISTSHYSAIELQNKSRAIVRPFCPVRSEHGSWKACVRAIESCKDTAVAVAQIFPVASRKFRSLAGSPVYPAQNTTAI